MLRFKDIKDFAHTLSCKGTSQLVFPGPYDDVLKSDSIMEMFFEAGTFSLANFLSENHAFCTSPSSLETMTFSHLLDLVNPPKICERGHKRPCSCPSHVADLPRVFTFTPPSEPPCCTIDDFDAWNDEEPEFLKGGYPNPLFCKDELYKAGREIMMKKNHDYRGGSGDPYANFRGSTNLGIDPILGILLRVQDKIQRIRTFAVRGMLKVEGESVKDALIDTQNYMDLIWGLIKEMSHDSK